MQPFIPLIQELGNELIEKIRKTVTPENKKVLLKEWGDKFTTTLIEFAEKRSEEFKKDGEVKL